MRRFIIVLATIPFVLSLAGCGQSGPLYLPGNPSTIQNVPNTPADTEQEDTEKEKQEDDDAS